MFRYKDFIKPFIQDKKGQIGIYKISFKNDLKNRAYIGSAIATSKTSPCDRGFYERWRIHISELKRNTNTIKLQRAFNKYGIENINFEILCLLSPGHIPIYYELIESGFIAKYNAVKEGFNICIKGRVKTNSKLTQETKDKISFANKGFKNAFYKVTGKDHPSSIPVYQYTLEGNFVKEWNSTADVFRELKIQPTNIGKVIKNERKSAGGFKWSREKLLKLEFKSNV